MPVTRLRMWTMQAFSTPECAFRRKENEDVFLGDQPVERRRHPRKPVGACAWLEFDGENAVRGMVSSDLSLEGARFTNVRQVIPGASTLVSVQLEPQARPIECKARVCWTRRTADGLFEFAVRFLDLHAEEQESLARFLAGIRTAPAMAAV